MQCFHLIKQGYRLNSRNLRVASPPTKIGVILAGSSACRVLFQIRWNSSAVEPSRWDREAVGDAVEALRPASAESTARLTVPFAVADLIDLIGYHGG
jgi:hypothetical protein